MATSDSVRQFAASSDAALLRGLIAPLSTAARAGDMTAAQKRAFANRILAAHTVAGPPTAQLIDWVFEQLSAPEWSDIFGRAIETELPRALAEAVEARVDLPHREAFRLVPEDPRKTLVGVLKALDQHLATVDGGRRLLDGMRVSRIMADVYALLSAPNVWRRRRIPSCRLDNRHIAQLKEKRETDRLPEAYNARINQLQRADLRLSLEQLAPPAADVAAAAAQMRKDDHDTLFRVESPLRLGLSSANASDNHVRTKEQGGKTLNVGVDLAIGATAPAPPLTITARRLVEARLVLRSLSSDFKADFEANQKGDAAAQADLYFAYRRGGDEALRMVKQALVHTGVVRSDTADIVADISRFTDGGGLEIITSSRVLRGSGLGTSSILAAAILKTLYRLSGDPLGAPEDESAALFDHSVLLEQSLGLNSGWQDARGVRGGPSAVKDYYAPPTDGLPAPAATFIDVDEDQFCDRVILFDTGIGRAATRGLNVVLDAYLSRDRDRYPAIAESLAIHDDMVAALRSGEYDELGRLGTRYWQLRCILDAAATNGALQHLFGAPELVELSAGGMMTGAGGGGFALIVAREGASERLRQRLGNLKERAQLARSAVVDYRLNSDGIRLTEEPQKSGVCSV